MILTDAGPLVSLLNEKDPSHARCVSGLESLSGGWSGAATSNWWTSHR